MGYILEKMMKGEEKFERCNDFLVPVLSYTVKGLRPGKEYQFRVRAENAAGISEPSRTTPMVRATDAVGMSKKFSNWFILQSFFIYIFNITVCIIEIILNFRSSQSVPQWQFAIRFKC